MANDADDSIIDSWEDADAEELERRMEERKAVLVPKQTAAGRPSTGSNEISKSAEDTAPVDFSKMDNRLPLKIQDSERTEYVSPIKILKRPEKQATDESLRNKEVGKAYKSLAEREADYASARERILGAENTDNVSSGKQQKRIIKPQRQDPNQTPPDDVVRHPKGPDGSRGFNPPAQHAKHKGIKKSTK